MKKFFLCLLVAGLLLISGVQNEAGADLSKASPSGEEVWRINCGGGNYTDTSGNLWMKDEEFYSLYRWGYINGGAAATQDDITGTTDPEIFKSNRRGPHNMTYKIEVPNGNYRVKLLFAETYWDGPGKRIFDVAIEGNTVWSDLDIYSWSGGKNVALELATDVTVGDGSLDITFPIIHDDKALISGIEIKVLDVSEEAFLNFIQKKMFWFFWNECNPNTGLIKWGENNWQEGYGNVASIATTGFGLSVLTIGAERGWVSKDDVYQRVMNTLDSFDTLLENIHGFWYHFVKIDTGERDGITEVSTVDSAIFILGALQAGEYFKSTHPDVIAKAEELYQRMDWTWFTNVSDGDDSKKKFVNMGWKPEYEEGAPHGFIIPSGRPEGGYYCTDWWNRYSEGIFVNLLALVSPTHHIDTSAWTDMWKWWVDAFGYHFVQEPPLFTHQYHHLYYDLQDKHDSTLNYFVNSKIATLVNRETCIQDPQGRYEPKRWGLTGCGGPDDSYCPYGGEPGGYYDGTVAPTAAITSIMFTPTESIEAAKYMYFQYKHHIWGRYGFCGSFNVGLDFRHWAVDGLLNASMIIAIENYRSGLVKNNAMTNQYISNALTIAGFKDYTESPLITASSGDGAAAVDGDYLTRWSSDASDPQWLTVDLGSMETINKIVLNWEAAYGKAYKIQVSVDETNWTDIYLTSNSDGGIDEVSFGVTDARYVRMYGIERGTIWGYSLWEMEIYYIPDPSPPTQGEITGNVNLQERSYQSALIAFELRNPGQTTALGTYQINTNTEGNYNLDNIPVGTYDLTAKASNYLRAKQANIIIEAGQVTPNINFSLLGGDANGDNKVNHEDRKILKEAYGSVEGSLRWDERADFNADNKVNYEDRNILKKNYGQIGD